MSFVVYYILIGEPKGSQMENTLLKSQTLDTPKETTYRGVRTGHNPGNRGKCTLFIAGIPFKPVDETDRPYFEWGCRADGAKRLAMTIIHDLFGEQYWTPENHNALFREIIVNLPLDGWELSESVLLGWMDVLEEKRAREDESLVMELIEANKTK